MDDKTLRAIAHLSEALHLLACVRDHGDTTSVPIHIGPADTGHTIHVTEKTAEAIADAVDSMNAYMASESVEDDKLGNAVGQVESVIDIDEDRMARSTARFTAWLESQSGEAIASGKYSAAAVAQNDPELYADVTDLFLLLDPIEITDKVIRDREASLSDVAQTLDDLFGDIPYPYDEEDVPLPHDQAQMDALADEAERYLANGGE